MKKEKNYTNKYYQTIAEGSLRSAVEVIPVIHDFIKPKSVIDVGCGTGNWLSVWEKAGVADICGVDGDYIPKSQLLINEKYFLEADFKKTIVPLKKYDLVMSLEVAEHIPADCAKIFVHSLCGLGDCILFSAAIPHQGGVSHVNEQYPEYWIQLFSSEGYSVYDTIREKIWNNQKIDTCYRQNIFFFIKDSVKNNYPAITSYTNKILSLVHPEHFEHKEQILVSYKNVLRTPIHAGWYFLKKYFGFYRSKEKK